MGRFSGGMPLAAAELALRAFVPADLWAVPLAACGALGLWVLLLLFVRRADLRFVASVVAAGFLLRWAVAVAQHRAFPDLWARVFAADAYGRHFDAARIAETWKRGESYLAERKGDIKQLASLAITLKSAGLYYIFGPSPLVAEAPLIFLGSSVAVAAYAAAVLLGLPAGAGRVAAALSAFLPSMIFFSAQDLKDPITGACTTWLFVGIAGLTRRPRNAVFWATAACALVVAMVTRPYVGALLLVGSFMAAILLVPGPRGKGGWVVKVAGVVVGGGLAFAAARRQIAAVYGVGSVAETIRWFNAWRQHAIAMGFAGSEYLLPISIQGPADLALKFPLLLFFLLFSPIPISPGTPLKLSSYPEMWFMYLYVLPRLVRGVVVWWRQGRREMLAALLAFIGPMVAAYAVTTSLAGIAMRMRTQFLAMLFIIVGVGATGMAAPAKIRAPARTAPAGAGARAEASGA